MINIHSISGVYKTWRTVTFYKTLVTLLARKKISNNISYISRGGKRDRTAVGEKRVNSVKEKRKRTDEEERVKYRWKEEGEKTIRKRKDR